jgi:hypothetical protein
MKNTNHRSYILLVSLFLISLIGFKDYGVMVKPFVSTDNVKFNDKEIVNIINEDDDSYTVTKGGKTIKLAKDALIVTQKDTKMYKVVSFTGIAASNGLAPFDYLIPGETVELLQKSDNGYIFADSKKRVGFVDIKDLENIKEANLTQAYSKVNKTLKSGDKTLALKKNDKVNILSYDGQTFTLSDGTNTYKAHKNDISLVEVKEEKVEMDRSSYIGRSDIMGLIEFAKAQIGKPYVYATAGPDSFDCSGLVYYCYKSVLDITVPRSSVALASCGVSVEREDLMPGDILLFNTTGAGISHAGIYIGGGKMIHASSGQLMSVVISDIDSGYYLPRFVAARRVIK